VDQYDRLFAVWQYETGNGIFFSMRDGFRWHNPDNLGHLFQGSQTPAITVTDDNHVHVVWSRQHGEDHQICYTRRVDNVWTSVGIIADASGVCGPSVAKDHLNQVHVAWYDSSQGNYEISYCKFDGSDWEPVERVTDAIDASTSPSIAVDDSLLVHMVWADRRDGNHEIYYTLKEGPAWGVQTRLTKVLNESRYPSMALDPMGGPHLVWRELRDGNHEIYYKGSTEDLAEVDDPIATWDRFTPIRIMPNPVQASAQIEFILETRSEPLISVYDIAGRLVTEFRPGPMNSGPQQVIWNGTGPSGRRVGAGVYFIKVSTETQSATAKTILLR
jgi:hypothetical protein